HLLAAYAAGDLAAMGRLLGAAQSETLLAARNRKWLPRLERYLAARGAFVAVGVSHLAGEDGLPAMLARAGYAVERAPPWGGEPGATSWRGPRGPRARRAPAACWPRDAGRSAEGAAAPRAARSRPRARDAARRGARGQADRGAARRARRRGQARDAARG